MESNDNMDTAKIVALFIIFIMVASTAAYALLYI
jgi:hypothetical protein